MIKVTRLTNGRPMPMRCYNPSDDELVRLVRRAASAKSAPFALVQALPGVRVFVARERDLHVTATRVAVSLRVIVFGFVGIC